jgi:hypothetical protein
VIKIYKDGLDGAQSIGGNSSNRLNLGASTKMETNLKSQLFTNGGE